MAFILIKFAVYPALGFILNTSHPVVAVVSESMEHDGNFESWWSQSGRWYADNGITKEQFKEFTLKNGFNKGDIMILYGKKGKDIEKGEVIVFKSGRPDPIIHRVVKKADANGEYYFQTKGDHNADSIRSTSLDETKISENQILGKAVFRVPFLGYIKIWFVELINLFVR